NARRPLIAQNTKLNPGLRCGLHVEGLRGLWGRVESPAPPSKRSSTPLWQDRSTCHRSSAFEGTECLVRTGVPRFGGLAQPGARRCVLGAAVSREVEERELKHAFRIPRLRGGEKPATGNGTIGRPVPAA